MCYTHTCTCINVYIWIHIYTCVCVCAQLCPIIFNPLNCNSLGSSTHGIFQAWILEWVSVSSSRGYSQPWDQTTVACVLCNGRQILYHWTIWNLNIYTYPQRNIYIYKHISDLMKWPPYCDFMSCFSCNNYFSHLFSWKITFDRCAVLHWIDVSPFIELISWFSHFFSFFIVKDDTFNNIFAKRLLSMSLIISLEWLFEMKLLEVIKHFLFEDFDVNVKLSSTKISLIYTLVRSAWWRPFSSNSPLII